MPKAPSQPPPGSLAAEGAEGPLDLAALAAQISSPQGPSETHLASPRYVRVAEGDLGGFLRGLRPLKRVWAEPNRALWAYGLGLRRWTPSASPILGRGCLRHLT